MLLSSFLAAGIGFGFLGIVLLIIAGTIDQQRRKGHLLRPRDLAALPVAVARLFGLGIFGFLCRSSPDEDNLRRREALADVALTMVGAEEPARPEWMAPAWIALIVLVVSVFHGRRLSERIPDLCYRALHRHTLLTCGPRPPAMRRVTAQLTVREAAGLLPVRFLVRRANRPEG